MGTTPPENPRKFDRAEVTRQVAQRRNEGWQHLVSVTGGERVRPPANVSRQGTIYATVCLRHAIERALEEIGHTCGVNGESLDAAEFIASADRHFREKVIPDAEKTGCPPQVIVSFGADPTNLMVECVVRFWQERFFEPQRQNIETMIDGMIAAAQSNPKAARRADDLLLRLRSSTLERYDNATPKLLDEVVHFLNVYLCEPKATLAGSSYVLDGEERPGADGSAPLPPSDSERSGSGQRKKRLTTNGDTRVKIIAALNNHHNYGNDIPLNPEPAAVNVLAEQLGIGKASVSRFFKKEFRGHDAYKHACADERTLTAALKLLNGDYAPKMLLSTGKRLDTRAT